MPNDLLARELPQTGIVVAAYCNEVCAIGTESAIPHPALMACQRGLKREWSRLRIIGSCRLHIYHLPDLGGVVCAARCQLLDIGRKEDPSDVVSMCGKVRDRDQLGAVKSLNQLPDINIALEDVSLCHQFEVLGWKIRTV